MVTTNEAFQYSTPLFLSPFTQDHRVTNKNRLLNKADLIIEISQMQPFSFLHRYSSGLLALLYKQQGSVFKQQKLSLIDAHLQFLFSFVSITVNPFCKGFKRRLEKIVPFLTPFLPHHFSYSYPSHLLSYHHERPAFSMQPNPPLVYSSF